MTFIFRWNGWNVDHIGEHGIDPREAEYLVNHARKPYPEDAGNESFRVRGRGATGRYLQVVFIFSPTDVVYVIHARPLTEREVRQYRRRSR